MDKTDEQQKRTPEMITISRAEYEEKNARLASQDERISHLENQIDLLLEALRLARHKRFGTSSEQSDDSVMEQLSFLFDEAEVYQAAEEEQSTVVAEHKRHKKHEYALNHIPDDIPTERVEHRLEGAQLICPRCGETMTEIGKEVVRTLKIVPAQTIVKEDIYYTYACRNCEKNDIETPVVQAPREKNIIPGGFATPEAIAHIMTQKFVMASPLYRQEQELKRMGIGLSRQTMSNWILRASEDYLAPVYRMLREELLKHDVLHADETRLQVLHEPGKTPQSESYMWLYRTSGDTDKPVVLFEYQPGRGAQYPAAFLKDFQGCLHADGYAVYQKLPNVTLSICWAHARRKFDEAVKSQPKSRAKGSPASQGLAYCDLLFRIEDSLAEENAEERLKQRQKQAKPVLDAMFAWANLQKDKTAPKSAFGKALTFLINQWPYLTNYLKDGRLELSNNRAERSIKPFVMGRKNWLFANAQAGAQSSAVIYSLIETAMENKLDPYRYLTWLLKTANTADLTDEQTVKRLLPWNAPDECAARRRT